MTETVAPPHPFDAAVGLTPLTAGLSTGETNPAYNNMGGPFGGVTAATLLESVPLDAALVHRTVSGRNRRHYRDGSVRYQA